MMMVVVVGVSIYLDVVDHHDVYESLGLKMLY